MDILITLPKNLIQRIREGKKDIELRKNYPRKFDTKIDFVFVVEKGTHDVVLSFRVQNFVPIYPPYDYDMLYPWLGGVNRTWINRYLCFAKVAYLWYISDTHYIGNGKLKIEELGIKTAPQSYAYIK